MNFNDKVLFSGTAGTGKTLLALEESKRKALNDQNIILLCFNKILAGRLKKITSEFPKSKNIDSNSIHKFMYKIIEKAGLANLLVKKKNNVNEDRLFKEIYPEIFLQAIKKIDFVPYDYLIIDECQDLINDTNLMVFDHILKKGLDKGKWSFFGDFEKQSMYENDSNIELLSIFSFTKYEPLNINCRNSIRVSNQNEIMTGVTYSRCLNIDNDENVTLKFPIMSSNIKEFDSIISKLIIDGVDLDRITTLYPEKSFWSHLISESSHKNILAEGSIGHSTIHSFKGLENDIIIVIGFKELLSRKARQLLYIAISRATFKLYLIFDSKLEAEFTHLISKE